MSDIKEFKVGEWIETMEGICQVLGSEKYIVENFFKNDYPELKTGDVFDNKIVYKIFCNFEGKPRKTKFITYYSSKWCDPISVKYAKLKEQVIKEHPELYEKFSKRNIEKPIQSNVEFSLRVDPKRKTKIIENINNLLATLDNNNFEYLQSLIYKNIDGILSKKLTNNDTLQTNVLIALKYNVLEANNGEFAFISGKATGTYCADDENSL